MLRRCGFSQVTELCSYNYDPLVNVDTPSPQRETTITSVDGLDARCRRDLSQLSSAPLLFLRVCGRRSQKQRKLLGDSSADFFAHRIFIAVTTNVTLPTQETAVTVVTSLHQRVSECVFQSAHPDGTCVLFTTPALSLKSHPPCMRTCTDSPDDRQRLRARRFVAAARSCS